MRSLFTIAKRLNFIVFFFNLSSLLGRVSPEGFWYHQKGDESLKVVLETD